MTFSTAAAAISASMLAICAGCQTTPASSPSKSATPVISKQVKLDGLQSFEVYDTALLDSTVFGKLEALAPVYTDDNKLLAKVPFATESRQAVLRECNAQQTPPQAAFLLPLVIGWAVDYISNWVTSAVQKEIDTYTKGYGTKTNVYFYAVADEHVSPSPGNLAPNLSCFRYTRKDPSSGALVMDVIGQIHVDKEWQYFQVRPLSVYFISPLANGHTVTLAMQLSANAVWFDRTRGRAEKVFDATVFSEAFTEDDRKSAATRYFFNKEKYSDANKLQQALTAYLTTSGEDPFLPWEKRQQLPLPPVAITGTGHATIIDQPKRLEKDAAGNTVQTTLHDYAPPMELEADFSEVGDVPTWLADLSTGLKGEKSSISKALTSAADKALGIKTPTSSSSSGSD